MNDDEVLSLINNEFHLTDEISYLNHAAVAPWPKRTSAAVIQFAKENNLRGPQQYPLWLKVEQQLRVKLKQLIGAKSTDEIALCKNTSEALSFVAYGLSWQQGDEIVISDQEFPSNRIVWESLQEKYGVRVITAPVSGSLRPENVIIGALTDKTRLVSLSSVQYGTGLRLNLNPIGEVLYQRNILFCVDAIQSVGICSIDVERDYIDFLMADGHKWMLGPEGLALFYIRQNRQDLLSLTEYGWHMVKNPGDYTSKTWEVASNATRFECGSPNMLAAHALNASIGLILEVGVERIEAMVSEHLRFLSEKLAEVAGIRFITNLSAGRTGGIITFTTDLFRAEDVQKSLMKKGVICAFRGGGIRFSPHFYTSRMTLERAVNHLQDCLRELSDQ